MKKSILPKLGLSVLPFVKRPFLVMFNVTQRCNLRCSYCFGQYYADTKELSLGQVRKILSEFYVLGARRLGLGGGEPLLYKDVDELIKFTVELGFNVGLNSNGILVSKHLDALSLLSNLSISLDGASPEINDRYRGRGSFEKAIEGVKAAHEAGIPLHFCYTLTDANVHEWPKILELGKKYDALVQISPLYQQFRGRKDASFPKLLKKEKFRKTIRDIIKEKKKSDNIFFSEATYRLILDWPDYEKDSSSKREAGHPICLAGKKMLTLDSNGKLFPCVRVSSQMKGQNCLEIGVCEAYNRMSSPPCKSCMWACYIEYNSLLNLSYHYIRNFCAVNK